MILFGEDNLNLILKLLSKTTTFMMLVPASIHK
jgi:hypothetical protein